MNITNTFKRKWIRASLAVILLQGIVIIALSIASFFGTELDGGMSLADEVVISVEIALAGLASVGFLCAVASICEEEGAGVFNDEGSDPKDPSRFSLARGDEL